MYSEKPILRVPPYSYAVQKSLGNQKPFQYTWNRSVWQEPSSLVFVLNGQGSQWENMGQDLVGKSSIFRSTMERLQTNTSLPLVKLYEEGMKWLSREYSNIVIVSFQLDLLAILRDILQANLFVHSLPALCLKKKYLKLTDRGEYSNISIYEIRCI